MVEMDLKYMLVYLISCIFSGEPPEKFVKYLARHEYKIQIKFEEGKEKDAYR